MYAKSRLQFTGKKMEPGCSFILKAKRCRKQKLRENSSSSISEGNQVNSPTDFSEIKQEMKYENDDVIVDRRSKESYFIKRKRDRTLTNSRHSLNIIRGNYNTKVKVKKKERERGSTTSESMFSQDDFTYDSFYNKKMFRRIGHQSDCMVECTVCFKQLKESSMKQHFKTHSGVKPFPCEVCGARFTRSGDAIRHRKTIHPNAKPFECCMCSKRFLDRKSLISHLQNHDKTFFYTCTTCGFKFGKKEYYKNHVWYIHPLSEGESLSSAQDIADRGSKQLKKLMAEETESAMRLEDKAIDESESEKMQGLSTIELVDGLKTEGPVNDVKVEAEEMYDPGDESCDDPTEELETNVASLKDVQLEKGTLSITQRLLSQGDVREEEELLVQQAICAAVSQAEAALENIQCTVGNNMTSQSVYSKFILGNNSTLTSKGVKKIDKKSNELHINATVRGHPRKFIIELPNSLVIDATTQEGMDTIVNIVNYLCSGKELSGPVEVVMHHALQS